MKYYTGVGSRDTPQNILHMMSQIGEYMAHGGYCLLSGGATGADQAFEIGCDKVKGEKQIFLPWDGFGYDRHKDIGWAHWIDNDTIFNGVDDRAMKIAEEFHPKWHMVGQAGRKMMARNTYQVLSTASISSKSSLLVCWTPDGAIDQTTIKTGGTGQAIRVARAYGVKVWNLQRQDHVDTIMTKVIDHQNKQTH